jgi:hypothetical protein
MNSPILPLCLGATQGSVRFATSTGPIRSMDTVWQGLVIDAEDIEQAA